jgi:hypothetical protein
MKREDHGVTTNLAAPVGGRLRQHAGIRTDRRTASGRESAGGADSYHS